MKLNDLKQIIKNKITDLESDEKLGYKADIATNLPLVFVQEELRAKIFAYNNILKIIENQQSAKDKK
ncbi:hypothetical protein GUU21_08900 [Campylobacter jejuni]|nr:hypothetical protein [Campylobacter jejuni]